MQGLLCIVVERSAFLAPHRGVRSWFAASLSGTVAAVGRGRRGRPMNDWRQGWGCRPLSAPAAGANSRPRWSGLAAHPLASAPGVRSPLLHSALLHCCALYRPSPRRVALLPERLVAIPNRLRGGQQVHARLHLDIFRTKPSRRSAHHRPSRPALTTEAYSKFPYRLTAS
jgi:hypothetical protein